MVWTYIERSRRIDNRVMVPWKRRRGRPKQRWLDNIDTKIGPDKTC